MSDFDPHDTIERKDSEFEGIIRPQGLDDFTGQKEIVSNLGIYIKAAKMRGEALDHVLFHGPPGLGKTMRYRSGASDLRRTRNKERTRYRFRPSVHKHFPRRQKAAV